MPGNLRHTPTTIPLNPETINTRHHNRICIFQVGKSPESVKTYQTPRRNIIFLSKKRYFPALFQTVPKNRRLIIHHSLLHHCASARRIPQNHQSWQEKPPDPQVKTSEPPTPPSPPVNSHLLWPLHQESSVPANILSTIPLRVKKKKINMPIKKGINFNRI